MEIDLSKIEIGAECMQPALSVDNIANTADSISIDQVDGGYVVKVGCRVFVVGNKEELIGVLKGIVVENRFF